MSSFPIFAGLTFPGNFPLPFPIILLVVLLTTLSSTQALPAGTFHSCCSASITRKLQKRKGIREDRLNVKSVFVLPMTPHAATTAENPQEASWCAASLTTAYDIFYFLALPP